MGTGKDETGEHAATWVAERLGSKLPIFYRLRPRANRVPPRNSSVGERVAHAVASVAWMPRSKSSARTPRRTDRSRWLSTDTARSPRRYASTLFLVTVPGLPVGRWLTFISRGYKFSSFVDSRP